MDSCSACGEALTTPLGCEACGALAEVDGTPSPFAVFGLEPAWEVDRKALRKRLLQLTRLVHPDHQSGEAVERAERLSSLLNQAYDVLGDDFLRADWLIGHLGGPPESAERQMPQAFLLEVLEWNERLDEADAAGPGSPEREALPAFADELKAQRAGVLDEVGAALTPLPTPGDPALAPLRRRLNAARYLSRALWRIRELRLAEAGSPTPPAP